MSTEKEPAAIQPVKVSRTGVRLANAKGIRRAEATTVASPTDPTPTAETKLLPMRLPSRPQTTKPASGRAGISQRGRLIRSPLQQPRLVDVDRFCVPEEGNEDREA